MLLSRQIDGSRGPQRPATKPRGHLIRGLWAELLTLSHRPAELLLLPVELHSSVQETSRCRAPSSGQPRGPPRLRQASVSSVAPRHVASRPEPPHRPRACPSSVQTRSFCPLSQPVAPNTVVPCGSPSNLMALCPDYSLYTKKCL